MSAPITLLGGAAIGMAAGALLVPYMQRELAASVARTAEAASDAVMAEPETITARAAKVPEAATSAGPIQIAPWHRVALVVVSGLVPAYVLHQVGWSIIALPPLLLLIGLVQLAYCDLTRRLLPKTLVYAVTTAVIGSGIVIAGVMHEW